MNRNTEHRVGFVTLGEYQDLPGRIPGEHETCEAVCHAGQQMQAVAVIALDDEVWGVCKDCFGEMDRDLGADASWHLGTL